MQCKYQGLPKFRSFAPLSKPILLGFLLFNCQVQFNTASAQTIQLGKPYLIASDSNQLVIELPISLPGPADSASAVRLANPSDHYQNGLHYPAWLNDATFLLRQGNLQRPTLRIIPKRGHPEPTTDLLLEFLIEGKRYLKPYHLLLEQPSNFVGSAIPEVVADAPPPPLPPAPSPYPVVAAPTLGDVQSPRSMSSGSRNRLNQRSDIKKSARSLTKSKSQTNMGTSSSQPNPIADKAITPHSQLPNNVSPTLPPGTQPQQATAQTELKPAPQQQLNVANKQHSKLKSAFMSDWPLITGGVLMLVLLCYVLYRLWQSKRADRSNKRFLQTQRNKGFLVTSSHQFANTVFGVSDEKANDMHQQWFDQKNLKKKE